MLGFYLLSSPFGIGFLPLFPSFLFRFSPLLVIGVFVVFWPLFVCFLLLCRFPHLLLLWLTSVTLWFTMSRGSSEEEVLDLDGGSSLARRSRPPICLVGRLCTDKGFNTYALIDVMVKAFKARKKVSAREWGNKLIIFTFDDGMDREWVLKNQPWHFDGNLFAIAALRGTEQPSSIVVNCASFWTRAYDLPIDCQSEKSIISLAQRIGKLEAYDPPIAHNFGNYVRFKVEIDISKPLLKGLKIRFGGEVLWIPLKYESLPFYCFCCGLVGHSFRMCDEYDKNECPAPSEMEFGPFLKASPLKKSKGPRFASVTYNPGSSQGDNSSTEQGAHPMRPQQISFPSHTLSSIDSLPIPGITIPEPNPDIASPPPIPDPKIILENMSSTQSTSATNSSEPSLLLSERPSIQKEPASISIASVTEAFGGSMQVITKSKPVEPITHLTPSPNPSPQAEPTITLSHTSTNTQIPKSSNSYPQGTNSRRTTWKRDAREKGREKSFPDTEPHYSVREKRALQELGDLMEIDGQGPVSKRNRVDSDPCVDSTMISAADASEHRCRKQ